MFINNVLFLPHSLQLTKIFTKYEKFTIDQQVLKNWSGFYSSLVINNNPSARIQSNNNRCTEAPLTSIWILLHSQRLTCSISCLQIWSDWTLLLRLNCNKIVECTTLLNPVLKNILQQVVDFCLVDHQLYNNSLPLSILSLICKNSRCTWYFA